MPLTDAQKQAYARAHNTTVELCSVELRHSEFPEPIRIIQHTQDVTMTLEAGAPEDAGDPVLFTGLAFRFQEPEQGTEPDNTSTIEIDGVPGYVQPYVVAANLTAEPIEATVRIVTYDVATESVLHIMRIYHLQVRHIGDNKTTVSLTMGYTNSANQAFPSEIYTPESNPGLQ